MRKNVNAVFTALALTILVVAPALAQDQGDQPRAPTSVIVTSSFEVPMYDRGKVMAWMDKYFTPGPMSNPLVKNYAVLTHWFGENGAQVSIVTEWASIQDMFAECKACEDWSDKHPEPKEGEAGYEEFVEGRGLFWKYYAHHHDEIYQGRWLVRDGKATVPPGGGR